eukprot:SAG31_NODE_3150_length_4617_cov_23.083001_4_plen_269_part_00
MSGDGLETWCCRTTVGDMHPRLVAGGPDPMCAKDAQVSRNFVMSSVFMMPAHLMWSSCDGQVIFRLPIPDSYCTEGVDADVILYPMMAQKTKGVVGWGQSAGQDQTGRPVILQIGWSVPTTATARARFAGGASLSGCRAESMEDKARSLILHEIVHGLGFSVMSCRSRYDSTGQRLEIIREGDVVDIDGESDTVWHAVSPRVLQVARDFFACTDLNALPLMGENILGPSQRGSHWETRILNDEFMAYGQVRPKSNDAHATKIEPSFRG